jgi:hypothetical protein
MVMNMGKAIAMLVLAGLVSAAVNAADYTPQAEPAKRDITWTPVAVETAAPVQHIELAPVVIYAKAPARKVAPVRQTAQCGAFEARALEQGAGTVRGFCL